MTGFYVACGIILFSLGAYLVAAIENRRRVRELESFIKDTTAMFDQLLSGMTADAEDASEIVARLERRINEAENP